jgi:hypothetical protein
VHRLVSYPSDAVRQTPVLILCLATLAAVCTFLVGSAESSITWRGDFETGTLSQWSALQAKDASRATVQSTVVHQGRYATRIEVRPGDNNVAGSGTGERTEVYASRTTTDGYEGQETYWAWSVFFPSSFDAPGGAWNAFTQFHHTGSTGQTNIHFAVDDMSSLVLRAMGGDFANPVRKDFTLAPLQKGRWYDFVFHVKWSPNPGVGFVQVWVNGAEVVPKTMTPTLYPGEGVYLKQGYYRSAYSGTTVLYLDGTRKGSSYDEVSSEFGSVAPAPAPLTVAQSIANGATLSGTVPWTATASQQSISQVRFQVDGTLVGTDTSAPFTRSLDTSALPNGSHAFTVEATSTAGAVAKSTVTAVVGNTVVPLSITQSFQDGQTLSGTVKWSATPSGKSVSRIEFTIDGRAAATEREAPYEISLDTTQLANRAHSFGVTAYASDGTTTASTVTASVSNTAPTTLSVTQNVSDGMRLGGTYDWVATPRGSAVRRVDFWIDGRRVAREHRSPFEHGVETTRLDDGRHAFAVEAVAVDGSSQKASAEVLVANDATSARKAPAPTAPAKPAPAPTAPEETLGVTQTVSDGQTLSGRVAWTASTSGVKASRVEFSIDGRLVSTERLEPYVAFGDQGTLDTTRLSDGAHILAAKAFAADGSTDQATANVTVANAVQSSTPSAVEAPSTDATSASPIVSTIEDGQTLTGQLPWRVSVNDIEVARVEFLIDGELEWTERRVPYEYGGDRRLDTGTLTTGRHVLGVRIVSTSGDVTKIDLRVTITR